MRDPVSVKNAVAEVIQVAGHPAVSVLSERASVCITENTLHSRYEANDHDRKLMVYKETLGRKWQYLNIHS